MSVVISLTNKKKIPMSLPDGDGKRIELMAGQTKMVRGDFDRYHRMMRSMNGLVVKLVEGKQRLVEAEKQVDDVHMVTVTNHRNIPLRLAVGIGQRYVEIAPKATSEPFLGRVKTVKQMSGISVKLVGDKKKLEVEKPVADEPTVKVEAPGDFANGADAEAIAKAAVEDERKEAERKEAEANDPLVIKRSELTLPATREEWDIHSTQMTWPDVRGLAKELEIKTKSLTKDQLLEEITKKLYPES